MKVLIVSMSDLKGGAARAAYRLFECLQSEAMLSVEMLVQSKSSNNEDIIGPKSKFAKTASLFRPALDEAYASFNYKSKSKTLFSPAILPFGSLVDNINKINPDIVHFHWVNGGMLRIEDLAKIKQPIVWSLHDMWPFTGGCHYDEECGAYTMRCGNCKVLRSKKEYDLSRKVFERKEKVLSKIKSLTIVGLSGWLTECAKKSTLFGGRKIVNIPNPINCDTFAPYDKKIARELLGLPLNKKLVLFGAMDSTSDPRKGFQHLIKSIKLIEDQNIEYVVFGGAKVDLGEKINNKIHYIGHVGDDVTLRLLYCSADVTAMPSIQENLSNTIMESMSCGTPVVAFDIGGNSDFIINNVNGYLSIPFDFVDFSRGIIFLLNSLNGDISSKSRNKTLDCFDARKISKKYLNLYESVIDDLALPSKVK